MRLRGGEILFGIRVLLVVILFSVIISTQLGHKNSKADVTDVAAQVLASFDHGDKMEKSTNRRFKKMYGLNASDYEGVVFYDPVSGMDAEEMLIIKLKSSSQSEEVVAAIERRLETQKNSFEGYGIEQSALLSHAIIDARGNFVFYIVHQEAQKADHAFRKSL